MITPDEFDTLVRDTLRDVDSRTALRPGTAERLIANAREGENRVVPLRRRTTWIAPLIAAAAVAAVAVGIVVAEQGGGGHTAPATQNPTSPVPTLGRSTPAPIRTPAPSVAHFSTTSVYYLDAKHGWALGDGRCPSGGKSDCPTVLRTTDGGASWHPIGAPHGLVSTKDSASCGDNGTISGPCVDAIAFASSRIGYLWSYHAAYLTTDGGAHWSDLGLQHTTQIVIAGDTAVRMATRAGCSAGCSYGVLAAPVGTTNWKLVIPYSAGEAGGWELAGGGGVAYVLEQFANEAGHPHGQALFRTTDGTHWAHYTGAWPCGSKAIDRISVDLTGAIRATCL